MKLLQYLALFLTVNAVTPAKIFSILPVGVKSHSILYDRLMKELAKRGHEITYLTPIKSKTPTENITEIIIPDGRALMMSNDSNTMNFRSIPPILMSVAIGGMGVYLCNTLLNHPPVKDLINSDQHFDLIFGEPVVDEAILAGFSYRSNAPIVALSTLMPNLWSNFMSGNPATSSYVADPLFGYIAPMTFIARVLNLVFGVITELSQRIGLYFHDRIMRQHFGPDAPYAADIIRNTSLVLVNHHPSLSSPRPQNPNTIDVAGMHIYPPKPLQGEFKKYFEESTNGVILFSLGTNVQSSHLPKQTIKEILSAFARLKENVLWKFEEELENLPKNVKIVKWLPQSDILAHPNLKLFITHGGLLSTTEAMFRGVPIVGIPVMADQPINMKHTENAGVGITLELDQLSEENLYNAVTEVLNNPKHNEAVKRKSAELHDTPMPPLETAVWWIEFVLRHKGAQHLRSPSQDLWWFQLHLIDVYVFLAAVAVAYLWLLKKIWRVIFKRKGGQTSVQKKNN